MSGPSGPARKELAGPRDLVVRVSARWSVGRELEVVMNICGNEEIQYSKLHDWDRCANTKV